MMVLIGDCMARFDFSSPQSYALLIDNANVIASHCKALYLVLRVE